MAAGNPSRLQLPAFLAAALQTSRYCATQPSWKLNFRKWYMIITAIFNSIVATFLSNLDNSKKTSFLSSFRALLHWFELLFELESVAKHKLGIKPGPVQLAPHLKGLLTPQSSHAFASTTLKCWLKIFALSEVRLINPPHSWVHSVAVHNTTANLFVRNRTSVMIYACQNIILYGNNCFMVLKVFHLRARNLIWDNSMTLESSRYIPHLSGLGKPEFVV